MKMYKISVLASFILISSHLAASESAVLENSSAEELTQESKVSIEWIEPKKFRDVRNASMSRKRYRDTVFTELEAYFTVLGKDLPQGQKLTIKVTDLDMAGTVQSLATAGLTNFSNNLNHNLNDYRIMREIDIPRMTFSYELKDADGKIIKQDDVELKDMSYLSRASVVRKSAQLRYEKVMISRWFNDTFSS
jgi:hypothetical protein